MRWTTPVASLAAWGWRPRSGTRRSVTLADGSADSAVSAWGTRRATPATAAANSILDMDTPFDISLGQPLPRRDSRSVGLAGEGVEGLPPYNTESPSVGDSSPVRGCLCGAPGRWS